MGDHTVKLYLSEVDDSNPLAMAATILSRMVRYDMDMQVALSVTNTLIALDEARAKVRLANAVADIIDNAGDDDAELKRWAASQGLQVLEMLG